MLVVPCITSLLLIIVRDATMRSPFIYCNVTLHVSGVVAPIIRSVTTAYGAGHIIVVATGFQRGQVKTWPCWNAVATLMI